MEIQNTVVKKLLLLFGLGEEKKFVCEMFLYCSNISGTEFKMNNNLYLLTCNSEDKSEDCFAINSFLNFSIENVSYTCLNRKRCILY